MRWLGFALLLLAAPAHAEATVDCSARDPDWHGPGDTALRFQMSLDEAETSLLKKGYKRLEPTADDTGRTYLRINDRVQEVTVIASLNDDGCMDYSAHAVRFLPNETEKAPLPDLNEREKGSTGPFQSLSRFRALGKMITSRPSPGGSCSLSIHSVIWNQSSDESINVCALLGRDGMAPAPLAQPNQAPLKEKRQRPKFELVPD